MKFLSKINTVSSLAQEEILTTYNHIKTCAGKGHSSDLRNAQEKLADLLNQSGLHDESREYFYELADSSTSFVDKSRLLRKVSSSYAAQREYLKAQAVAEEALTILCQANQNEIDVLELFEALTACAFSNYFISKSARLKELIKEMRYHFHNITDKAVRLRFYFVVMLDMLLRHRWYMLPEESITHGEFYLQLALETQNWNTIGTAYSGLGFVHLWREEFELARKNFEKALEILQNRNFDLVLTSQVYITVSYRMQDNISMTEKWAAISLEVATKTQNQPYIALSYSNLAWVYARRNNWLYAEDYARMSIKLIASNRHPMLFLCLFPLLECLFKNEKYEEAGMYCFFLLHPSLKELPTSVNRKLELMNVAWLNNRTKEMAICLDDVITEAKLTNYF